MGPEGRAERGAPTVSIVTPVYNTARWLADCLEASLAQTFGDFELLVSDNASTDGSLEIAERFARKDPRVRVFAEREHLAQTANFNRALRRIHPGSRYCKMVLADDRMHPDCLEKLVAVAEIRADVGLVSSQFVENGVVLGTGLATDRSVFDGREVCREQLLRGSFYFGNNSVVLYRADLVRARQPFYDPVMLHDDTDAAYRILASHDLGFVHEPLVTLGYDDRSISGSVRELNPRGLDKLGVILVHGRTFLSEDEYRACLEAHERKYYRAFARAVLSRRRAAYVEYHRRGLERIGYRLSIPRLAGCVARELGRRAPWIRSRS